MSTPVTPQVRPRSRGLVTPVLWTVAVAVVGAFTALAVSRSTPVQLSATSSALDYAVGDGTTLHLEPGASVHIMREYALWGGATAHLRFVRWRTGKGTVTMAPTAPAFVIDLVDAQVDIQDGALSIDVQPDRGTLIQLRSGHALVTAKTPDDLSRGLFVMNDNRLTLRAGGQVFASSGTLELLDDIATEEDAGEAAQRSSSGS